MPPSKTALCISLLLCSCATTAQNARQEATGYYVSEYGKHFLIACDRGRYEVTNPETLGSLRAENASFIKLRGRIAAGGATSRLQDYDGTIEVGSVEKADTVVPGCTRPAQE